MSKNSNPIIIVAGEPKSVFLELYFKSFQKFKKNPLILIANKKLLKDQMKLLKNNKPLRILNIKKKTHYSNLNNKKINLIDIPLNYKNLSSLKIKDTNIYIKRSFDTALEILKKNKNFNLINGPIIKKSFLNKKYLGITEYLGSKYNKLDKVVMLIYNKNFSVSPLTTHIPLKDVFKKISKRMITNHVKQIQKFFIKKLKKKPSFGVTGLNPHCESNYLSSEENNIIKPAIKMLQKKKFNISGPFPADTIFIKENIRKFDVIIGMYHDQVLAPVKAIHEFDAINITLGLPFIRISPDHGPNISQFGKNKSNAKSLIRSIEFLSKK